MRPWAFFLLGFSTLPLAGCSGAATPGPGDPGDPGDAGTTPDTGGDSGGPHPDAATNSGWGTNTDVASILADSCSSCHGTGWSGSCFTAEASASELESVVSAGYMPLGAPLSASDKSTLLTWLASPSCSGPEPDGGIVSVPIAAGEIVESP
jgi:hypothetical protein